MNIYTEWLTTNNATTHNNFDTRIKLVLRNDIIWVILSLVRVSPFLLEYYNNSDVIRII